MSDLNRVNLIGNVGQEPEFKYFESGCYVTNFSLAVKRYDSKAKEDVTNWFKVKTFSKLGEFIKQGTRLAVDGKLQIDNWETEEGEKKKSIYIFADFVQILTPKEKNED